MRRSLTIAVSLAVSSLFAMAPAAAHNDDPDGPAEPCPTPEVIVDDYDTSTFAASATLLASGCPAREQRQFPLWLSVTRYDDTSAHGSTRGVLCGPFRPVSEADGQRYSCDVDVAMDHPSVEHAYYSVEATYPAADGEDETLTFGLFCVSEDGSYGCELEDDPR